MEKFCECGCGGIIKPQPSRLSRPLARFLPRHHLKLKSYIENHASKIRKLIPSGDQINSGICACGCGESTPIAQMSNARLGHFKGFPVKYIHNHNWRGKQRGPYGNRQLRRGYWLIYLPDHHLASKNGYVREHRKIWEDANGQLLPPGYDVHHIDEDRSNNSPENLQAMTSNDHMRLHALRRISSERFRKKKSKH